MDWILALAMATFVLLLGFLWWNKASTKRNQQTGGNTSGIGGPNDPISGTTPGIRDPETMRKSLDQASARHQ